LRRHQLLLACGLILFQSTVQFVGAVEENFQISKVKGNTAKLGSRAEFTVRLNRKPTSDVTIAVRSSDTTEGKVHPKTFVFTPENWDGPQFVSVVGQNQAVVNGEQNYTVVLSTAVSEDPSYSGQDPDDVLMRGLVLEISAEPNPIWVTEGQPSFWDTHLTYTGGTEASIRYELLNAPAGMSVNRNGTINWIPPVGSRGTNYSFTLRATTSRLSRLNLETSLDLQISVAPSDLINVETNLVENELRVSDATSNMNGIRFKFITGSVEGRAIRRIDPQYLPPIDPNIIQLTDTYYSNQKDDGEIEILVPLSLLGSDNNAAGLMEYHRVNEGPEKSFWVVGNPTRSFTTIDGVEYAVLKSLSTNREHFIGIYPFSK